MSALKPVSLFNLPAGEAARRIALIQATQARRVTERLLTSADLEALHDFRVALRRLRVCLKIYGGVFKKRICRQAAREIKRIAAATNPCRDAQAHLFHLRELHRKTRRRRQELASLMRHIESLEQKSCKDIRRRILPEVPKTLDPLVARLRMPLHDGPRRRRRLADFFPRCLNRHAAKLQDRLSRIKSLKNGQEIHRARIAAKRLRYLLEPFEGEAPFYRRQLAGLRDLQNILGTLHDIRGLEKCVEDFREKRPRSKLHWLSRRLRRQEHRLFRSFQHRLDAMPVILGSNMHYGARSRA